MTLRQDIRFCMTPDGVRLAMALYGSGPPLVKAATWLTHVERDPVSPHARHWIEELGRRHTYVTYDMRGCGMSSRHVDDVSMDAWVRDLETVVDTLGLEQFPLLGISQGAAIAVAYAARHPERVSRMVLFGGFASSYFSAHQPDPRVLEEAEMLIKLTELGWGKGSPAFRRVFVAKCYPHGSLELQGRFDEYSNLSAEPAMAARCFRTMFSINVREQARQVRCPVLVMHMSGDQLVTFDQGRRLASLIPGARLVPLPGDNHVPLADDAAWPRVLNELRGFLGDTTAPAAARLTQRQR
jgi:pimeloyl-ACP methyl ester carboxylesterase